MPSSELQLTDEHEYERQYDEFEKRYWDSSRVNGAIPICEIGCALRIWLVVTGSVPREMESLAMTSCAEVNSR